MAIRFFCENCAARVKVPKGAEGRRVRCPRCGNLQRVPQALQRPAPTAGAPGQTADEPGTADAAPGDFDTADALSSLASRSATSDGQRGPDRADEAAEPDALTGLAGAAFGRRRDRDDVADTPDTVVRSEAAPPHQKPTRGEAGPQRAADEPDEEAAAPIPSAEEPSGGTPPIDKPTVNNATAPRPIPLSRGPRRYESSGPPPRSRPQRLAPSGSGDAELTKVTAIGALTEAARPGADELLIPEAGPIRCPVPKSYMLLLTLVRFLRIAVMLLVAATVMAVMMGGRYDLGLLECFMLGVAGLALSLATWTLAEVAEAVRDIARKGAAR